MNASRSASRRGACNGPRHPVRVQMSPLSLSLGLSAMTVGAVSAGPAYLGTHKLVADASVHITLPTLDLSGPHEWVIVWEFAGAAAWQLVGEHSGAPQNILRVAADGTGIYTTIYNVAGRNNYITGATAGLHYTFGRASDAAPFYAHGAVDGGSETASGTSLAAWSAGATPSLYIGAFKNQLDAVTVCAAGAAIREVWLYTGGALGTDRTAVYASGVPGDLRPRIVRQPVRGYDMSNFYDSGAGGWKVRDLITTDGSTDGTVVGGDNTDIVAV